MILNQLPNLRVEDFPSEQSWINRLFVQLNPFMQGVSRVFNGNVDFSTNIKSVTKSYDITTFQAFSFLWSFADVNPVDVRIVQATKGVQQTPTILLLAWSFDLSSRSISISRITEIGATGVNELSGRYQFTIRATV